MLASSCRGELVHPRRLPRGERGVWGGAPGLDPARAPSQTIAVREHQNIKSGDHTHQRVKASLTAYLGRQLKLPVNEKKSQVAKIEQCVFLGFTFRKNKLRWSDAAFADFKHRLRELTGRSWGVSMPHRFEKLGQYLRGWMGYFGISEYYRPIPELDEWLRRRVRMGYWKQWRLCRTKISHLLALGVDRRTAILTGVSGKSYWHLSRSKATQVGMTNDWLRAQGLVSIRNLWMKAHGYA